MKKSVIFMLGAVMSLTAFCQNKVVIKSGTIVPLQSIAQVKAADVNEGDLVQFRVVDNIKVDDNIVIPQGLIVNGKVTEAKKSTVAGTKGRLGIDIQYITLANGEKIFLTNGKVNVTGKNRTPLAVCLSLLVWPCIFIPGTKAVMPVNYEVQPFVVSNTEITL